MCKGWRWFGLLLNVLFNAIPVFKSYSVPKTSIGVKILNP